MRTSGWRIIKRADHETDRKKVWRPNVRFFFASFFPTGRKRRLSISGRYSLSNLFFNFVHWAGEIFTFKKASIARAVRNPDNVWRYGASVLLPADPRKKHHKRSTPSWLISSETGDIQPNRRANDGRVTSPERSEEDPILHFFTEIGMDESFPVLRI